LKFRGLDLKQWAVSRTGRVAPFPIDVLPV
jgi:hypothetical protein